MKHTLLFLILFGVAGRSWALGPPAIESNKEGLNMYKEERYDQAFQAFSKALGKDPFNPTYHFNLGTSFFQKGQYEEAMSEFDAAAQSPDASDELKFQALFNGGVAATEKKDIDRALQFYQRALEQKPDSKETKTNIELLLQEKSKNGGGDGKDQDKSDDEKKKSSSDQEQDKEKKSDPKKEDKQEDKGGQQGDKKDEKNLKPKEQLKKQAKPFQSQSLNESDVRQILEELKRQEEKIRAKQYKMDKQGKKAQDKNPEKDW